MTFLSEYGLYAAKLLTLMLLILILFSVMLTLATKGKDQKPKLRVKRLNKKYSRFSDTLKESILDKKEFKLYQKEQKKDLHDQKNDKARRKIFLIDFLGDIKASETPVFSDLITAILTIATSDDEVVVRLESPGGIVHLYGLAASQLKRLRDNHIPLVVTIDKVAASGGYMMACIANRIIAAPFAIVGSIGVIAQLPNFNKLLKKHNIEFEQIMAGEYKRTLSLFGENTNKDREKMQEDVEIVHKLFKQFVIENRPQVDIDKISTGEIWHGVQALQLNLVDQLMTSDEYLLNASRHANIFELSITGKKSLLQRLTSTTTSAIQDAVMQYLYFKNKIL